MSTETLDLRLASLLDTPPTIRGWFATVHKEVGMRYLVTAFVFLVIGGAEVLSNAAERAFQQARKDRAEKRQKD